MRRILLLSAAASALVAGSAVAADLPNRSAAPAFTAPAPRAVTFDWSGFYAGLNAGYAWNTSRWSAVAPTVFTTFNTDGDGFVGGGFAGFNWQMNQFVLGLEGQLKYSGMRGSAVCAGIAGTVCRTSQDWIGDIDVRAGFAADRALIFATGGVAFTNYKFTNPTPAPTTTWGAGSRTGWTVGIGLDYAITNNWIAGLEYKYYDFGSATSNSTPAGTNVRFKETESTVMGRVSYKFSTGGSPIAARF
jgi:outer membrane immunogenic protein